MKIVMGVPGAGKSTVLSAVEQERKDCKILNYGTLMSEIAIASGLIRHRDELRKLPIDTQKEIQAKVAYRLSKEGKNVILDTHCSIRTPTGFLPGLPDHLLSHLPVDAFIYITAPPDQIFERRRADTTRVRTDDATLESLMAHENENRRLLAHYSKFSGAPSFIIENMQGGLKEAQKRLLSLL